MPKQMILTMTATLAVLSAVEWHSHAADAQAGRRDPAALFARTDANKDGKISRSEYVTARAARFNELDHNKDGAVSEADFERVAANPRAAGRLDALIAEADGNKDGKVTRAELRKAPSPGFDRADTNHDGWVTSAELSALRGAVRH